MKSVFLKLLLVLTLTLFVFTFASCSSEKKNTSEPKQSQTQTKSQTDTENKSSAEENTKYGDAKIYEKDGVPHAKTRSGQEVEISGNNLAELIEEYEKVKGSGSAKEKELLDKIQLILEAPRN